MFLEHFRQNVAAEMIVAACGEVAGPQHFLVLDVRVGNGKHLGAEAKLAEGSGHRIIGETRVVGINGFLIPLDQGGADDTAVFDVEDAERAILIFHRELAVRVSGHKIHFARR